MVKNRSLRGECAAWGFESRGLVEFKGAFNSSQILFFKHPSEPGLKQAWCACIKREPEKELMVYTVKIILKSRSTPAYVKNILTQLIFRDQLVELENA